MDTSDAHITRLSGVAGMVMIAIGSTTFMLLAKHLTETDPSSISRTLHGLFSESVFSEGQ